MTSKNATAQIRALSIHPEYAMLIALGKKPEEYRSWTTKHRGPLAICSTKAHGGEGTIPGHAICVVDVVDMKEYGPKDYGWVLKNPRFIKPKPVRGKQGLYWIEDDFEYMPDCTDPSEREAWMEENFYPYILGARKEGGKWIIPDPTST